MVTRLRKRYGRRGLALGGLGIGLMLTGLVFSAQLSTGPALSYVSHPSVIMNNGGQILYVNGDEEGDFENSDGSYGDPRNPQLMLAMSDGSEYILAEVGQSINVGSGDDIEILGISRYPDVNNNGEAAFVCETEDGSTPTTTYCFNSNYYYSGFYTCTYQGTPTTYRCCYTYTQDDQALFVASPTAGPTLVARLGDTYDGKSWSNIRAEVSINDAGQVGFVGDITEDDGEIGLFRYTPGTGVELMLQYEQTILGKTVNYIFSHAEVNSLGHMLAFPTLDNTDDDINTDAIIIRDPGDAVQVASIGDFLPNGDEIIAFDDDSGIPGSMNDNDQVVMRIVAADSDYSDEIWYEDESHLVLWSESDGFTIIARTGDPVGTTSIEGIASQFGLNDNGQVAFQAGLKNYDNALDDDPCGIFFFDGTDTQLVMMTGENYNGSQIINFASPVEVNNQGQVFFLAQYDYTENNSVYDSDNSDQSDRDYMNGLFCWSQGVGLTELLRMGDSVDGQTVSAIDISIATFGDNINDNGAVSFRAVLDGEESNARVLTRYCPTSCQLNIAAKSVERSEKGVQIGYKVNIQHNMDRDANVPTTVTLVDENKQVVKEFIHSAQTFKTGHWVTLENTLQLPPSLKAGRYELHVSIAKMRSNSHRYATIYVK